MNIDDVIEMAREAGAFAIGDFVEAGEIDILRFANLIAAAEREACAKLCDELLMATECATAIRARGQA